jgi:glycosyltransferase involved in cell wall biosynthesis
MPVYNEAAALATVLPAWTEELARLGIDYELLVYDDGSADGSDRVASSFAEHRVVVRRHPNRGHGPTIMRGYHEATGDWVFQVDSDGEISPAHFHRLWSRRADHDVLLGCRKDRQSPVARRIVTWVARLAVGILFGRMLADVNTPYRLMRRKALQATLAHIPSDTFAPNVAISGLAARADLRIHQEWVPHSGRVGGRASLVRWSLVKGAARAFVQTIVIAVRGRFH